MGRRRDDGRSGRHRGRRSAALLPVALPIAMAAAAMAAAAPVDAAPAVAAVAQSAGAPSKATAEALASALSRPAPAAAGQGGQLPFRRDPAVAERERKAMLARIESQGGGGSGLARSVESGRMLKTFDGLLRRNGYSPDDLGDVLSAYLVLAWEVVNDADATAQREGMRAVRRQVGPALAALPQFSGLDDAARQARAQNTAYMAMVATLNRQAFKAAGDDARLATLQREVGEQIRGSTGLDLREYRLGPGGLAPR